MPFIITKLQFRTIFYIGFLAIASFLILSQASESAYGKIMVLPDIMKTNAFKGSTVTMNSRLYTNGGNITINANATDLVEQNGKGVIPSSSSQVILQNQTLKENKIDNVQYTLHVPPDQTPGIYNGTILLLYGHGNTTLIPLQVTIIIPDYYAIFGWLTLGAVISTIWTGLNDLVQTNPATSSTQSTPPTLESGKKNYKITITAGNGSLLVGKTISPDDYGSAEAVANSFGAKFSSVSSTANDPDTKIDDITSFAKKNKQPTRSKVLFRASVTAIGSIMAVAFVFNQFLQSNPAITDAPMGGWYIALGAGFLAHHALDNLIDEGTATLKSKFSSQS